ncbi:hypothetical protein P152DRAFT_140026 [Eremomyces bilateralis CBS 781.70]|uniref:Uncharacterized protein n=1 Tax=Eremomyces bilateralis CBS 781.70 TaxID=1392243 RepID=A0A6G1FWV5_9PEZI|nr:uncharacterized protein P152DRAFT_140026 [Eremomyces bilateralis CBS 781.70]KAF1810109.1 hypothetical protein P152DRAFT_140026 [Eremomyces bilateralis CBS 781.70]
MPDPPALTTTFTPPASCFTDWFFSTNDQQGPSRSATECFPSGFGGWEPARNFYFSPGVCPISYVTRKTSLKRIGSATETIVACCPSGYNYIDTNNDCFSLTTPGPDVLETETAKEYRGSTVVGTVTRTIGNGVKRYMWALPTPKPISQR